MRIRLLFSILMICALVQHLPAQQVSAPEPQTGTIVGTITDVRSDIIPEAAVSLESQDSDSPLTPAAKVAANDNGFFIINYVRPGIAYHLVVSATGFAPWTSPSITLQPGQYLELSKITLQVAASITTVTAVLSPEEIATEQVHIEEKQRVLGFVPNFYVVYDQHPAPLTAKLKFQLALHTSIDPVTFLGAAFISAVDQAGDTPDYGQGAKGYAQRFGANYTNGVTDILFGGAILPSLLHQDPRYYYQGTGTTKSRLRHALTSSIICKGDNGKPEFNFSSIGGFLISGAIAESYYPERNRGPGLVFNTTAIDIAANMANGVIQEFLLRHLTPSAKKP
ncbi:hypothetical protein HNQ77_002874 [Silvibacterium bohemicum]|uniref:Carboxypeptidase regulatory-like domain-containing protein n=1 Tax=Silvibacterium bohemicum TaxID=1577686 RepID=A0A841K2Q6_9BACT|nr:carboxypeptidase-like regulatory domain-containing protein [Silvibacterium bohemicum]MBB6144918.1 hypothetical protein [Silvibacterium bohemicum]